MLPAGSSHNTRFTLCRYCLISTIRPSSRTGINTTQGAWRMVAISWILPSGSGTFSTSTANTRVEQTIAMDLLRQLVDDALKIFRQRTHKFHAPVLNGVGECESGGVQERTLQVRDGAKIAWHPSMDAAVQRIAHDRMIDVAQ